MREKGREAKGDETRPDRLGTTRTGVEVFIKGKM